MNKQRLKKAAMLTMKDVLVVAAVIAFVYFTIEFGMQMPIWVPMAVVAVLLIAVIFMVEYDTHIITDNPKPKDKSDANKLDTFVVVDWSKSKELMEKEGFSDNAVPIERGPVMSRYGYLSYLVDKKWYMDNA